MQRQHRLQHLLALGLTTLGLAGCVAPPTPAPVAPPAPPRPSARLLLRSEVPAGDRYAVMIMADALNCQGPKLLSAGQAQQPPAPVSLPAGQLATLDYVIFRGEKPSCAVRWSFTPVAGKNYLINGLPVGATCTARLLDATVPDRMAPPPDLVLRSGQGQACMPLAQARAAAAAAAAGNTGSLIQGGQVQGEAVLNPRATTADLQGLIKP